MRQAGREGGEAWCLISGISSGVSASEERRAGISRARSRAGHGLGVLASPLGVPSSWGTQLSAVTSAGSPSKLLGCKTTPAHSPGAKIPCVTC